jgi:hypothetical protein
MRNILKRFRGGCGLLLMLVAYGALAAADKPNILVIWGDDIGQSNISAYTHGARSRQCWTRPTNTTGQWLKTDWRQRHSTE